MSVSTFQLASPDISLPSERSLPRTLAAIAFLVAFIFVRFLGANVVEQQTGTGKGKK